MSVKWWWLSVLACDVALTLMSPATTRAQADSFPEVTIAGSRVTIVDAALRAGMVRYRYLAWNGPLSDAPISSVGVAISAAPGMRPAMLPGGGNFLSDGTYAEGAQVGHVPIGMDAPPQWTGNITPQGLAEWYAPGPGLGSDDPIQPGTSRSDFVLRSPYLPGVRRFELLPHYPYLCCPFPAGDPRNEGIDVKFPEDFKVEGFTVGPEYAPAQLSLDVLRQLADQVCGLDWITNAGVCTSLQTKLDHAARSLQRGNPEAARDQLRSFLEELDAQHGDEPGKHVTGNAYWLLRINGEFLLSTL